jgi:riboflavin kinase / FMN adenylyltransferase
MIVIGPNEIVPEHLRGGVVAIGNFDGLHRGHQELLAITQKLASTRKVSWGLLTFEPHPRSFFRPLEPVFRLTPYALKLRLVKALGADFIVCLTFDENLAASAPEDFIDHELVRRLGLSHIVTGYDFHFGKGRKGGPETLRAKGAEHNFGVTVVDQVTDDGDEHAPFSSSSIRSALRRGHVKAAAHEPLGSQQPTSSSTRAQNLVEVFMLSPSAKWTRPQFGKGRPILATVPHSIPTAHF